MGKKIVGYFGSWSCYRPGAGKFDIEDINPNMFTHLIYSFVGLSGDDVKVLDAWRDLPDNGGKDGFKRFNNLRNKNDRLKTLVAIGGWNEGSEKYSVMASKPDSRARFVKNVIAFVKKYNFNGFDVDWEYPAQRGGSSLDIQNFTALIKELRRAFDNEGLILSAAVGAAQSSACKSYEISKISKYLHFINLMTYDFHGPWESRTGFNAPLYAGSSDAGDDKQLTVDAAVKYWILRGVSPEKLIIGTATYGRSFTLANARVTTIGAKTSGPGHAGPYTRESGMLGYNEICEKIKNQRWTVNFDRERRAPYTCHDDQWVGYDNVKSIKEKADYVNEMGLGGAMVWAIETDDFKGITGEINPLIKTLYTTLRG